MRTLYMFHITIESPLCQLMASWRSI